MVLWDVYQLGHVRTCTVWKVYSVGYVQFALCNVSNECVQQKRGGGYIVGSMRNSTTDIVIHQ